MKNIVVVGSINTDMVVRSPKIPIAGQTLMGSDFQTTGGGKGANQAVAAARLGGNVTLVGKVGSDGFGAEAIQNFQKEKINTVFISIDPIEKSGVALIVIDENGENMIVVASGANGTINDSDLDKAESAFQQAFIILFQLEIALPIVEKGIKLAKKYNKKTILNPAPAALLPDEIFSQIDIFTPNQTEAEFYTNIAVNNVDDAANAAALLHKKGIEVVIITMGEQGAYISSPTYNGLIPGFQAGKVVDTVAAGDTFCGALAIGISEGISIEDAVKFANAAAALSVTKAGAQASVPFKNEVIKLLEY
jgi:ribokinase